MDCSFTFEQPKVAEVLRAVGAARQIHGVEHRHVGHLCQCIIPHQESGVSFRKTVGRWRSDKSRNECTARGSVGYLEMVRRQALGGLDRGLGRA